MNITVVAVGRARKGPIADLCRGYTDRLPWPTQIKEVEDRRGDSDTRRVREGELQLRALPDGAFTVALDQTGQNLNSETLAARLATWRDDGVRELAFLIGGADGLAPAALARADFVLSLGAMTWPHMLVRAMLCEQLFRSASIQSGHPYHRGNG